MTRRFILLCAILCIVLFTASATPRTQVRRAVARPAVADIVFTNARILTMDDARPTASAMAIAGERIAAVGADEDVRPLIAPDTKVYDLGGRSILPGLNETHIHVRDLGFEQDVAVNLESAATVADVQRMLRERLTALEREGTLGGWRYPTSDQTGPWLFGLGWTQDRLQEKRMATRHELDAVSRDVPISLTRIYRGMAVNTKVFELLGYRFEDPATWPDWFKKDPADFEAGDIIFRDADGLPNGVFVGERAPRLIARAIPEKALEQRVDSLVRGLKVLSALGFTAIVEPGSSMGRVTRAYQVAYDRGLLPLRVNVYDGWYRSGDPEGIGDPAEIEKRLEALGVHNLGDEWLRLRGVKSSADGGLGSRSAAVSVPYLPIPQDPLGDKNLGALRDTDENRLRQFRTLFDYGWEIHTHACGDVAIKQTMDVYKTLLDENKKTRTQAEPRWSIIHCYLPDEPKTSVIDDMARYGIIAAINPANLYFEGDSFARNVGPNGWRATRRSGRSWSAASGWFRDPTTRTTRPTRGLACTPCARGRFSSQARSMGPIRPSRSSMRSRRSRSTPRISPTTRGTEARSPTASWPTWSSSVRISRGCRTRSC